MILSIGNGGNPTDTRNVVNSFYSNPSGSFWDSTKDFEVDISNVDIEVVTIDLYNYSYSLSSNAWDSAFNTEQYSYMRNLFLE